MGRSKRSVVAYVLPWPGFGGGEVATLRMACALKARGEFDLLALCRRDSSVASEFCRAGIETIAYDAPTYSYRRGVAYARGSRRLARELRARGASIVHASDLLGVYHAALAARLAGLPCVTHIRSAFPPEDVPWHYKLPLLSVEHFVFVSQAVRNHFNGIYRVPAPRASVIYDWVPPTAVAATDDNPIEVRRSFGLPDNSRLIGMVARVAPQKDFETLLSAMTRVVQMSPEARLLIVGEYDRPETSRTHWRYLCGLVTALGLDRHVVWAGFRSDVPALMRAMDVVVLATRTEGFGLAVLEAMQEERPVVATRVGGIPEMISDGANGLLHEPGDPVGLAQAICRLLADPVLAATLAARARITARSCFAEENTLNAVTSLYTRVLGSTRAAVQPMAAEL